MAQVVQCPDCKKSYAFKPELAGKRVKCKCGGRIQFPAEAPVDAPPPQVDPPASPLDEPEESAAPPVPRPVGSRRAQIPAPVEPPADMFAETQVPCPHCKAPLAEGAAVCTACGFNIKTGARVATQVVDEPAASAPPKKPRNMKRLLLVMGIILLAFGGLSVGGLWMFGGMIPGMRKVPVLGWLVRTRFDECRIFIPGELVQLSYVDVRALRKSQYYLDNKDAIDKSIGGAFPNDKSINAVDRYMRAAGASGAIVYFRFNADQPKERVFPGGKAPQSATIDKFTAYVLPGGQEAMWIDARQLLLGSHKALLSAAAHYESGDEASQPAEMMEALDAVSGGDVISAQSLGGLGNKVPKASGQSVTLGSTVKAHTHAVFTDSAAVAAAMDDFKKAQSSSTEAYMKNATIAQQGNALDVRMSANYSDLNKSLKGMGF